MSCIQSASKWEFMMKVGLNHENIDHQSLYWQMKREAIEEYDSSLRNRSEALKSDHRSAAPPFSAHQFTEAAINNAIQSIENNASDRTRPYYVRGRNTTPNWVIRWMLYHVCRYRDGRNKSAQSKKFHDDDHLDPPPPPGGSGSKSSGSKSSGSKSSDSKSSGKFYDTARNGYVSTKN